MHIAFTGSRQITPDQHQITPDWTFGERSVEPLTQPELKQLSLF